MSASDAVFYQLMGLPSFLFLWPRPTSPKCQQAENVESGWAVTNHDVARRIRGPSRILGNDRGFLEIPRFSYLDRGRDPSDSHPPSGTDTDFHADIVSQRVSTF